MKHRLFPASAAVFGIGTVFAAGDVRAQRADDNAIADAEDAFGSNDGGEDLGLFDVRGFSPIDAGNVRMEGIFIDRQCDLSPRLMEGDRIRVGPSNRIVSTRQTFKHAETAVAYADTPKTGDAERTGRIESENDGPGECRS